MRDDVREANEKARRLLAYLHEWSMKGRSFRIGPNEETFKATALNQEEYTRAADRLIRKHLADHSGSGYVITVTPEGVRVAEDDAALNHQLPIGDDEKGRRGAAAVGDKRKVFVIHGRNLEARKQMGIYLRALGLEPINFDDLRASLGGTPHIADIVMAGMQQAHGVVALFTGDEYAALRPDLRAGDTGEAVERWQSRPNVLFEAGIAFGIDRDRVVIVKLGKVSLPSDVGGIHALSPTNDMSGHRSTLRNTLKWMGCAVSDGSDWMKDGDFEAAATVGLPGMSPKDPFSRDPAPAVPVFVPASPPAAMHDDEARVLLAGWLSELARTVRSHGAQSPQIREPADIAREAGVPEAKVSLLASVGQENEHFGVTVKQLQGGKIHFDIGPAGVRQVRNRGHW
jgi:predicted nucleotide-binding protein